MANFNPISEGMGIGPVGLGDPNLTVKRKNLWTLEIQGNNPNCPFKIPPYFVKIASRPNISFEETEINFLNDKMWLPGKATWEAINVTFMDVAGTLSGQAAGGNLDLYQWLLSVFDFRSPTKKFMNSKRMGHTATATLKLWDGCGTELETWTLGDVWPQAINFGDLDQSSSDTVDIELTLRYSKVSFVHYCPGKTFADCCLPCS